MIVMKFGGASSGTPAGIDAVGRLINAHRERAPLIVVSAIGKTTRAIDRAARGAALGNGAAGEEVAVVLAEHRTLARNAFGGVDAVRAIQRIDSIGERLQSLIEGISIVRELSPRSLDACLAIGEELAAAIFLAVAEMIYVPAASVMITDNHFGAAAPLASEVLNRTRELMLPPLNNGSLVLTEGYIGSTPEGDATTMGMESSDYSASLFGAALGAEEVQIWTNVNGIMTVDPRLCDQARTIPVLSYVEAEEMAALGAKVLHPKTIEPLQSSGIPLTVRNAANPNGDTTMIFGSAVSPGVKAIAVVEGVRRDGANPEDHTGADFRFGARAGSRVIEWRGSGDSGGQRPAAVSLIGEGIGADATTLRAAIAAVPDKALEATIAGASENSITLIVGGSHVRSVVSQLHTQFLELR